MIATARFSTGDCLTYRCNPSTHRIVIGDAHGRTMLAFGGHGARAGELDTPLDLAFVAPEFHGECLSAQGDDVLWLAVADYGNRRVQIFEPDGCFVGSVRLGAAASAFGGPCQLTWRAPMLDVGYPDGRIVRVHLAGALWRDRTTDLVRRPLTIVPVRLPSEAAH